MVEDRPDPRRQILAAATRLFAAHGFDATPVQAVADEVGLTKAAVLHHFASKDDLRRGVLATMVEHWREILPPLLLRATASEDPFDLIFDQLHRFFASDVDRARLVVREALDRPQEAREILRGSIRPWLRTIATHVEDGRRDGRVHRDADPEAYLTLVMVWVTAAAAVSGVLGVSLDGPDARLRLDRELRRIARSSLFKEERRARVRR